ncbi:sensor histidine kinase [Piscinibacter sakaiensis]|uniref:histidine kinase n=1 Tax=Piscinibacter sakaiensis TaxID=1547922 RepID=A0A0K8NXW3_PISS1|nr:HAMP domain-containing sensor histidine kinase [Piscinibacter sakaiensis]GAP35216.1 hypothetical protein ISF6_0807 [Piscinibacter sakaiensis]
MTLQQRVRLALVLLVALFTLVQGGLAVWTLHEQEDDLADDLVRTEAQRLAQRIERGGPARLLDEGADGAIGPLLPDRYEAWWQAPDGRSLPGPLPAGLAGLRDGPHRDHTPAGGEYHLLVMPVAGGRLVVRYDAAIAEQKVGDFAAQLAVLGAIFIGLAIAVSAWVAELLMQPLARVARLMDDWAPPPPPRPGEGARAPPAADEEGRLLDAFGRVQARWEHALAREGELLADLRHEVRTPLTALRTDLELLQVAWPGPATPGTAATDRDVAARQRVARMLSCVDAVAGTLASLRAIDVPGQRSAADQVVVPLADAVDDAWDSLGDLPAQHGLVLVNEVARDSAVRADRHALTTILRNLMRNAAEHAAPARCRVHWDDGALVIEDDGQGIPRDELPFVFERYYRGRLNDTGGRPADGGDQRGLGLAIARRAAEQRGWSLGVGPREPQGTRFVLRFGA